MSVKRKLVLCSAIAAMAGAVGTVSAVKAFRQVPIVERLEADFKSNNQKLDAIKEQSSREMLLCVKSGGRVDACMVEREQKVEAATRSVDELFSSSFKEHFYMAFHAGVAVSCAVLATILTAFSLVIFARSIKKDKTIQETDKGA